ncbi:hypothetical protein MCAP1_003001 [Malassezia caprae]|uniref:Uncharacterized protein n=1 Tax=Malassezia caprae TaxID=1381934 RepID=A0AAF0E9G9_9BASI|nr:hypothetical protein MCAP1_003001 [Malassezia caprae]
MAEFQKESLTLEETNRVRVSLGLKPLTADVDDAAPVAPAPVETPDDVRARLAQAQDRRELARQLRGPTLGDAAGQEESARDWVRHAQRRAQARAAQREREDADAKDAPREYDASELAGLRVAHDMDEFGPGTTERVLTLRDADVLADAEDELVESSLDAAARDRAAQARQRAPRAYTGLDDDEIATGRRAGVLSQYDEGHDESSGFRLGDAASVDAMDARAHTRADAERHAAAREQQRTDLSYEKNVPASDYEVSFKKKSKKKKRSTRVHVDADEPHGDAEPMAVDPAPRTRAKAETLIDDDELAASLARARRQHAKAHMAKMTPEAVAQSLATQPAAPDTQPDEGLTLDATSEFVRQIVERPPEMRAAAPASAPEEAAPEEAAPEEAAPEEAAPEAPDEAPVEASELPAEPAAAAEDAVDAPESGGLASTLQWLRSQGVLEHVSDEQRKLERTQLQHDAWLQERRREERARARMGADEAAAYDRDARMRERREAEAAMERFRDYKPDIKLEYHDEYGRTLSTKEAWKQLSHTFHGNAPGAKAQEKRLRRIAEEQRRERMLAGDTSAMTRAFQERSERTGQAHMVLSVGQRDHAPQDIDLGAPTLAKPAPTQRKAPAAPSKAAPRETAPEAAPREAAPSEAAPEAAPSEPAPSEAPAPERPAFKPAMKPAFAPISAAPAPASAAPTADTPEAPRGKIRIALGKRKAS